MDKYIFVQDICFTFLRILFISSASHILFIEIIFRPATKKPTSAAQVSNLDEKSKKATVSKRKDGLSPANNARCPPVKQREYQQQLLTAKHLFFCPFSSN